MQIKAFSGKGLVRKPGNADSVILTTHAFEPAQASLVYNLVDHSVAEQAQNLETKTMAETNDALKPIQDELAAAKAEIKSLSEKLQANASQNYETTIAGLKADIVAKDAQISNLTEQVATVTASHTEVAEKLTTVTASLTEKSTELEAANAELAKVVVEKTKAARIAAMIEKGAASDKAASLAEKFASFSEEQFTETVEVLAAAWAAAAAAPAVEEKPTAAAVISDVVETAKASQQNVNLAAVPSVEKPEVRKSTANFFKGFLRTAVSGDEASLDSE
jgi:chromosome segregation ATPase